MCMCVMTKHAARSLRRRDTHACLFLSSSWIRSWMFRCRILGHNRRAAAEAVAVVKTAKAAK